MHARTHPARTLAGILLVGALLASCSDDGTSGGAERSDEVTSAPGPTMVDGSAAATTTAEETTDDLEQSEVDPCVIEPAELRAFVQINEELIGPVRDFGPGVPTDGRDPWCDYEDLWEEDTGGATYFTVTAKRVEFFGDTADQWCIVVHRGICLSVGNRFSEDDSPLTPPPAETLQAIKDRLDQG